MQSHIGGLYLAPPHGELIWNRRKETIVRPEQEELAGKYILVSAGRAYGIIEIGGCDSIPAARFDEKEEFAKHRITKREHERWWPDADPLYSYEILNFEKYDEPIPVVVQPGVGMLMDRVEFKEDKDMPYSSMEDVNPSIKGIKPPVTLAQANLIASWADSITGVDSPWAVAISKFKKDYRVEGGKWVKKSTKVAKELLESMSDGDIIVIKAPKDETEVEAESGVEEVEDSETESQTEESTTETAPEAESEEVAQEEEDAEDAGTEETDEEKSAKATLDECVCPECGATVEHDRGEPCTKVKCPKCGAEMHRATDEDSKAQWTAAYINSLPDSSFLYVESGGKKDNEGKTTPRSKRHLPVKDKDGKIDLPHLKNAASRLGQSGTGEGWLTASLRKTLQAKAQRLLKSNKAIASLGKVIMDGLKDILGFSSSEDETESEKEQGSVFLTKSVSGEPILITRTTNAFKDREGEYFTTESLHALVDAKANQKVKGTLQYKHMRGTDFADTVYMGVAGRFLVEAHKFHNTPLGDAFRKVFEEYPNGHPVVSPEGWGVSHGFKFDSRDKESGVYKRFDKHETSVLPAHVAANPYTNVEVVLMDQEKSKQELAELVGADTAEGAIASAEQETDRLEKAGVEHKMKEESQSSGEEDVVKAVGEAYELPALAEAFKTVVDDIKEIKERLALIEKTDVEKLEQKAQELPRFNAPWSAYRASQDEETTVDKQKISAAGKSTTDVANEIVSHMSFSALAGSRVFSTAHFDLDLHHVSQEDPKTNPKGPVLLGFTSFHPLDLSLLRLASISGLPTHAMMLAESACQAPWARLACAWSRAFSTSILRASS
jgi:hypothetical protein